MPNALSSLDACPSCGKTVAVRPKLLLIDEAWVAEPGKDPRLAHFADLRVDDVKPELLSDHPLEQVIEGLYCDACGRGFVTEDSLMASSRKLLPRRPPIPAAE
jgi:hypothetical protein